MIHKARDRGRWLWAGMAMLSGVAAAGGPTPEPECGWTLTAFEQTLELSDFAAFDEGNGRRLYASVAFGNADDSPHLLRWDGSEWTPVGTDFPLLGRGTALSLAAFEENGNRVLYVGGTWAPFNAVPPWHAIARWDGSAWSVVDQTVVGGDATDMVEFDDGAGSALYVGGGLTLNSKLSFTPLVKWDGHLWSDAAPNMSGWIYAVAVFDDGSGPTLYASGGLTVDGQSVSLARLQGGVWQAIPGGPSTGSSLAVHDDGSGPALYAGGDSGGVHRWDGASWSTPGASDAWIYVGGMTSYSDAGVSRLYVVGASATSPTGGQYWDGVSWSPFGDVFTRYTSAITTFDDGSGQAVFANPFAFSIQSLTNADGISRWVNWASRCPNALRADYQPDCQLNFFDIHGFLDRFLAQDPTADFNVDGLFNFVDVSDFVDVFVAGCP
jgi:hypothetical protein